MSNLPVVTRVPWLLVSALVSVITALLAFMLKRSAGTDRHSAVLAAGAAFASCMLLCLAVLSAAVSG
ncbi:hypothetical protein ACF9IK_18925 [Kitasatospora hibisci]|uniref:hypothetical protein n=1 Tax=Kitasatospora hibisci TaxID=3369522 RepID=UPI0037550A34